MFIYIYLCTNKTSKSLIYFPFSNLLLLFWYLLYFILFFSSNFHIREIFSVLIFHLFFNFMLFLCCCWTNPKNLLICSPFFKQNPVQYCRLFICFVDDKSLNEDKSHAMQNLKFKEFFKKVDVFFLKINRIHFRWLLK